MFFSFFSCAKKRTSICFFLRAEALGIPKGDACYPLGFAAYSSVSES
jgi:hypothetical protein